jgi:heme/copper-type cytochrome/quinol oxidase subunit 2
MANINIQRRSGTAAVWWVIAVIALIVFVWWAVAGWGYRTARAPMAAAPGALAMRSTTVFESAGPGTCGIATCERVIELIG